MAHSITRVSNSDKLRGHPVPIKRSGTTPGKRRGLLRVLPDGGRRTASAKLVGMTQQQYPGQFSQSTRSEGDAGTASGGRADEFSRFRSSLPRRSREHRVLGGVCGGLAEAWDMPVTAVRVGALLACLLPGPMCLVYAAAWCLMLDEPAPGRY